MKVDVIIIGSGIAGLAIAAALGRHKLKALVISPDIPASNFDFEYIFENSTITNLPDMQTFETLGFSYSEKREVIARTLLRVNSKSLYQRFLMSCADNGVGMMHGRVEKVVSYRKLHRVDWVPNQVAGTQLPGEELFAPLVIDASGAESLFSPKVRGFSSTFRKVFRGKGNLLQDGFSYVDYYLNSKDADGYSFSRGFKHEDGSYILDEICLYSVEPESESFLESRLMERLQRRKFQIDEEIETTFHYTPIFSEDRSSKILSFGDAAAMANPLTGEATSRIINDAPKLAKVIAESLDKSPQEIADRGREILFSKGRCLENAMTFLFEHVLSTVQTRCEFFEILFSSDTFFDPVFLGNASSTERYASLQGLVKIVGSKNEYERFHQFEPKD